MKTVMIEGRPYRAFNIRNKDGQEWADVEGHYGDIMGWRKVGCANRIAQVIKMECVTKETKIIEQEGQLTLF